jgi:hypothetical protein
MTPIDTRPSAHVDQAELHNKLAGEIVASIVKPVLEGGGSWSDVLIVTESVVVGISLAGVRLGGDEKMLDIMIDRARQRLAEIRLGDIETVGRG